MLETAGMRLCRSPAQELRKKKGGKYVEKQQWIEYLGHLSYNFSLCNLDGRGKTLKLLYDVWKEVIFKTAKDCTNDFGSCLVIV